MAQHPVEVILARQWASLVTTPVYLTDTEGTPIYWNDAMTPLLGASFEEFIELPPERLSELFSTTGLDGDPIPNDELPLLIVLNEGRPAHKEMRIRSLDGSWKRIESTVVPMRGDSGRTLGALGLLWIVDE